MRRIRYISARSRVCPVAVQFLGELVGCEAVGTGSTGTTRPRAGDRVNDNTHTCRRRTRRAVSSDRVPATGGWRRHPLHRKPVGVLRALEPTQGSTGLPVDIASCNRRETARRRRSLSSVTSRCHAQHPYNASLPGVEHRMAPKPQPSERGPPVVCRSTIRGSSGVVVSAIQSTGRDPITRPADSTPSLHDGVPSSHRTVPSSSVRNMPCPTSRASPRRRSRTIGRYCESGWLSRRRSSSLPSMSDAAGCWSESAGMKRRRSLLPSTCNRFCPACG